MKLQRFKKYLLMLSLLGFCGSGWATLYPIPDPLPPAVPAGVTLGADIDGSGLFNPGNSILSVEIFDLVENTPLLSGAQFGFYYGSDPSTLIPLFDSADTTFERATVNFDTGVVTDLDLALSFSFIPQAGPIGFYTKVPNLFSVLYPDVPSTIYTQALLNDSGVDWSAAYPLSGTLADGTALDGGYLIGFTRQPGVLAPLYASAVGPLTPVPAPGTFLLLLTGLAGVAQFRRRRLAAD